MKVVSCIKKVSVLVNSNAQDLQQLMDDNFEFIRLYNQAFVNENGGVISIGGNYGFTPKDSTEGLAQKLLIGIELSPISMKAKEIESGVDLLTKDIKGKLYSFMETCIESEQLASQCDFNSACSELLVFNRTPKMCGFEHMLSSNRHI